MSQFRAKAWRNFLSPEIALISVPREKVRVCGPFEETISPLLHRLRVGPSASGRVVIPCLTAQLPAIYENFGTDAIRIYSKELRGQRQASLRSLSLPKEFDFPYHIKLAVAYTITGSLRTISPWTAILSIEVSDLLQKLLPRDIWVFREVASVCSAQDDFDLARHLSVLVRENLEERACELGQSLIICGALAERALNQVVCNALRLFKLNSVEKTKAWFRRQVLLYPISGFAQAVKLT